MPNSHDAITIPPDQPTVAGSGDELPLPPAPANLPPLPESVEMMIAEFSGNDSAENWLRVPGYEIRRLIGRGATGKVFEARHIEFRRFVAIKILLPTLDDWEAGSARFRSECTAAARIHHPNIVDVFDCGVVQGSPYLVMELVSGGSLAESLSRSPLPPMEAAQYVAAMADAIGEAHRMGVIHRDLKPANVLRTADGDVKITDFGLAKLLEESDPVTRTGAVIGTPAYMAPEQAQGHRTATPEVDIYALGAILYECLTGRPPFRAATALATIELVRSAEPIAPRALNPSIPRDLETICLKCLDKSPSRRYSSAMALADDLEAFRNGRPIMARRVGVCERAWKWVKRHPAIGSLAAVLLMAIAGAIAGAVFHVHRLQVETLRANQGETAARTESDRADRNYQAARETLEDMLQDGAADRKIRVWTPKNVQKAQAERALTFYRRIAEQSGSRPEVRYDAARAALVVARLEWRLGQMDQSLANAERAREHFIILAASETAPPAYRAGLADALTTVAGLLANRENHSRIEPLYAQAIAILETLVQADPQSIEHIPALATAYHNLGNLYRGNHRISDMERCYRVSIALKERLVAARPDSRESIRRLADTELCLSVSLQGDSARGSEAEVYHNRAASRYQQLLEGDPTDVECLSNLAQLRANWAYVLRNRGQTNFALEELQESATALKTCFIREPDDTKLQQTLHSIHGVQAQLLDAAGRFAESARAWEQVVVTSPTEARNFNRLFFAEALAKSQENQRALAIVDEAMAALPAQPQWQHLYSLASTCGLAAANLANDRFMSELEREKHRSNAVSIGVRLMQSVKKSISPQSWKDLLPGMRTDPRFAELMREPAFQELIRVP